MKKDLYRPPPPRMVAPDGFVKDIIENTDGGSTAELTEQEAILISALWYANELGLNIVPAHGLRWDRRGARCTCSVGCQSAGKHPRVNDWVHQATTFEAMIVRWFSIDMPGSNIGAVVGGEHGWPPCLDVDVQNGGDKSLKKLTDKYGPLPKTWTVATGNGGQHYYFQRPSGDIVLSNSRLAEHPAGLDFMSDKKCLILPPSIHVSGRRYSWTGHPHDTPLAPMPEWLQRLVTIEATESSLPSRQQVQISNETGRCKNPQARSEVLRDGERNNGLARIAWRHRRAGASQQALCSLLLAENKRLCRPKLKDQEVLVIAKQAAKKPTDDELGFERNKNHIPYPNRHNIEVAVKQLGYELSHDAFSNRLLCNGEPMGDGLVGHIWLEIERCYKFRPSKDYFWTCAEDIARSNPRHPVREYLDALTWDRKPRLNHWLPARLSAPDNEYTRAVGAITLIAAVRRVRHPGTKFDEMLILEGDQGTAKSTALEILAVHDAWFSDDLPLNADTKRQMETMAGRWIIEASELNGMRKGEVEHLKSFLSRRVDRSRMAWGRLVTELPRQCIVIGTTNSDRYLQDMTGNRRFWPVATGTIDIEGLKRDRDQMWAEAAAREAAGESIRLPARLWPQATQEQEDRALEDGFYDILKRFLDGKEGKVKTEWLWELLLVLPERRTMHSSRRLGEVMKKLGWQNASMRFGPGEPTARGYWRGNKDDVISVPVPVHLKQETSLSPDVPATNTNQ